MKQNFLLQEVINDLVNLDVSLSAPLIKLQYFGRLIKNQELIDYAKCELTGYRECDKENIPSYRRTIGTLYIDLQTYNHIQTEKLPVSMLEEPFRTEFQFVYLKEGIAAIEKLLLESKSKGSNGHIETPLPMELLYLLQTPARKLYKSSPQVNVIGARLSGNSNIVVEIPNAIRTKLLDFVISIAENFGYDIEIDTFNSKSDINNQIINNYMNTIITNSGDGNLINTGDKNQIESNVTVHKGDISRLKEELKKKGIDENDIAEIVEIIIDEEPNIEEKRLGEKSNGWISKIINKSLNGVGEIVTEVSAVILATLIKQYYGMP